MKKRMIAIIALAACGAALAFGDANADLAEGIRYHNLAEKEPAGNIDKCKKLLNPLKDREPLARGYYGSVLTMEASVMNDKKKFVKAIMLLDQGTDFMDTAVKQAPDVQDLRILRMINSYELTNGSPMNRYRVMKEDIDWLDAHRSGLSDSGKGTLELYKGLYLVKQRKTDEGIAAFNACVAVSPGSEEAKEAERQLARYK